MFQSARQPVNAEIASTGNWDVMLGRIDFKEPGVYHVQLRPTSPATWKALNLWQLQLRK